MLKFLALAAVGLALTLPTSAQAAGKYQGWSGNDCVSMGNRCIASCDKYGVPETKASCMFNCAQTAMQCVDIVKGDAASSSGGKMGPRGAMGMSRAPLTNRITPSK